MKTREYFMVNTEAFGSYGEFETLEEAIKRANDDGTVKKITYIKEESKVVWKKPDYKITEDEVIYELKNAFEYDEKENSYLTKDAIKYLLDMLIKNK